MSIFTSNFHILLLLLKFRQIFSTKKTGSRLDFVFPRARSFYIHLSFTFEKACMLGFYYISVFLLVETNQIESTFEHWTYDPIIFQQEIDHCTGSLSYFLTSMVFS